MKRSIAKLFAVFAVVSLVVSVILVWFRLDARPRTDDAFIEADVVHLAPDVSGRIVSLNIRNNQSVRAGDILFVIDPEPYQLKLDAQRAHSRTLEAQIADTGHQISSQSSRADAAYTSIGSAQAQFNQASSTLARLEPLLGKGFVTAEQIDQARTAKESARVALEQTGQQAVAARQAVSSIRPLEEQLAASQVAEALAQRDLDKTVVRAPFDGKVTALNIAVGEYANVGHPLFTLIDTAQWYAVANFRETEIARMRAGIPAKVFMMAEPNRILKGHIDSVGWGVQPEDVGLVNGLPRVAKTLDWVRLAQRFQVRVKLDDPPDNMVRIGASAVVVVCYDDKC